MEYFFPPVSGDASAQFQGFIDSLPDAAPGAEVVVRFMADEYQVDKRIILSGRKGITFEGPVTITRPDVYTDDGLGLSNRPVFCLGGHPGGIDGNQAPCERITFDGVEIVGPLDTFDSEGFAVRDVAREAECGIWSNGTIGLTIRDTAVRTMHGPGLHLGHWRQSTDVVLDGFTADRCGLNGVSLVNVDDVTGNLTTWRCGYFAIDCEPDDASWSVSNVHITDSSLSCLLRALGIGSGAGIVNDITVEDTVVVHSAFPMVSASSAASGRRSGFTVRRITAALSVASPQAVMSFGTDSGIGVDDVTIDQCTVGPFTIGGTAIAFEDCGGSLIVTNNSFPGAGALLDLDPIGTSVTQSGNTL